MDESGYPSSPSRFCGLLQCGHSVLTLSEATAAAAGPQGGGSLREQSIARCVAYVLSGGKVDSWDPPFQLLLAEGLLIGRQQQCGGGCHKLSRQYNILFEI